MDFALSRLVESLINSYCFWKPNGSNSSSHLFFFVGMPVWSFHSSALNKDFLICSLAITLTRKLIGWPLLRITYKGFTNYYRRGSSGPRKVPNNQSFLYCQPKLLRACIWPCLPCPLSFCLSSREGCQAQTECQEMPSDGDRAFCL